MAKEEESQQRPIPKEKGKVTLQRLLGSAEAEFRARGFERASVSGICRRAGVAQGTFYLYFANKEDVFVRLVKDLEERLVAHLTDASSFATVPQEKLAYTYAALLDFLTEHEGVFRVFREAEFVRPEIPCHFYASLATVFADAVREGTKKGVFRDLNPEVVAYAIVGAALFLLAHYVLWSANPVPAEARRVGMETILHGIGSRAVPWTEEEPNLSPATFGNRITASAETKEGGEATRKALLEAAERAFGQAGFHGTSVSTITYLAGVGQGTFYLYFPSKVAVFQELVREVSRELRRGLSGVIAACRDRRTAEVVGLKAFFKWVERHPGAYRILREAEFVDEGMGRWHYTRLAQRYAERLAEGMQRGEIRRMNPQDLAYVLTGMAHLGGQRWVLWEKGTRAGERAVEDQSSLVLRGLEA